ncbi:hypothetical protein [Idiomarina sp.]|uniref:hypothetical protein n=1 Tax=Idiomarina sp. TaxID=1874361 RepID=UPI002588AC6D|nr:hypothetical protein [Idiomarina sp.]
MQVITLLCFIVWSFESFQLGSRFFDALFYGDDNMSTLGMLNWTFWLLSSLLVTIFFALLFIKQRFQRDGNSVSFTAELVGISWLCLLVEQVYRLFEYGIYSWHPILDLLVIAALAVSFFSIGFKKYFTHKVRTATFLILAVVLFLRAFIFGYYVFTSEVFYYSGNITWILQTIFLINLDVILESIRSEDAFGGAHEFLRLAIQFWIAASSLITAIFFFFLAQEIHQKTKTVQSNSR